MAVFLGEVHKPWNMRTPDPFSSELWTTAEKSKQQLFIRELAREKNTVLLNKLVKVRAVTGNLCLRFRLLVTQRFSHRFNENVKGRNFV